MQRKYMVPLNLGRFQVMIRWFVFKILLIWDMFELLSAVRDLLALLPTETCRVIKIVYSETLLVSKL